jgi:hypothetical protein
MLRTLLLLIAFSFINVYANAHKSNDGCAVLNNVLISDPIDLQNDILLVPGIDSPGLMGAFQGCITGYVSRQPIRPIMPYLMKWMSFCSIRLFLKMFRI